MGTILDLNGIAYHQGIDYLKSISIMGQITDGYQTYQINPKVGRGLIRTDPINQTTELTDTVDAITVKNLMQATKCRRLL